MWYLVLEKCDGAWWWRYARTLFKKTLSLDSYFCMIWNWFFKWWKKCFSLTFSHHWGWISNASAPAAYAKGPEIISVHGRPVGAAIASDSIDQWIVQAREETRLWRTWCLGSLHPCTFLNVAHSILHVTYTNLLNMWHTSLFGILTRLLHILVPHLQIDLLCNTLLWVRKRPKSCNF